jgi:hypothetical protein
MAKRKYSGALAERIKKPDEDVFAILFPSLPAREQLKRKLPMLAQLYGLNDPVRDHDAAVKLLLCVCEEAGIPGFQVAGTRGRRAGTAKKWNWLKSALFVCEVESMTAAKKCSKSDAIWRYLNKPGANRVSPTAQTAIKSGLNRFAEARKRALRDFPRFDDPKWREIAIPFIRDVTAPKGKTPE